MNCEKATQLASLSCEEKLSFKEKTALQLHFWICPKCRYFYQNNAKLSQLLKNYCDGNLEQGEKNE